MSKRTDIVTTAAVTAGVGGLAYLIYNSEWARRLRADATLQAAGAGIVRSIAAVMACPVPPLRIIREIPNAAANAVEIGVNPEWLYAAMNAVCSDPGCQYDLAVGILAHEVSHFAYGDAFAPPSAKHAIELRADDFAGTALARLGISPDAFSSIIWQIARHHSSGPFGYPNRHARVAAIGAGYEAEKQRILVEQYRASELAAYGLAG